MQELRSSVFTFGYPEVLQFDGGSSFDNQLLRSEMRAAGVQVHRTTPYNHQSNGVVERVNRTVLDMVRTLIDGNTQRWADVLPGVAIAYNSAVHSSTGVQPAAAVLRFPLATPLSLHAFAAEGEGEGVSSESVSAGSAPDVMSFVERTSRGTAALYDRMSSRSQAAVAKQSKQYDSSVSPLVFKPGDFVYVYAENRDGSNKLSSYWRGPRKIVARVSEVLYTIEPPPEGDPSDVIVRHVNHLRPANAAAERMSEQERILSNAAADTNIVESVVAHSGTTPETYRFLVVWRGWGSLRATWEPLVGRTTDGHAAGVGKSEVVLRYMRENGLSFPATGASSATSAAQGKQRRKRTAL